VGHQPRRRKPRGTMAEIESQKQEKKMRQEWAGGVFKQQRGGCWGRGAGVECPDSVQGGEPRRNATQKLGAGLWDSVVPTARGAGRADCRGRNGREISVITMTAAMCVLTPPQNRSERGDSDGLGTGRGTGPVRGGRGKIGYPGGIPHKRERGEATAEGTPRPGKSTAVRKPNVHYKEKARGHPEVRFGGRTQKRA